MNVAERARRHRPREQRERRAAGQLL